MKRRIVTAAALAALMSASVFGTNALAATSNNSQTTTTQSSEQKSGCQEHGKKEKVAEPENAIGKDKAKAAALKDAGISESKAEKVHTFVIKLDDGTVVYRVSFKVGEKYYIYKINALTGKVADKRTETSEEHEANKKARGGHGRKEQVAEPENAIGKDKAKAAAIKDAGFSESKVDKAHTFVIKLGDGTVVYRVSLKVGDKYYIYKINALTGKVADKRTETAEEHEANKKAHGGKNKTAKTEKTTASKTS